jgi:hypothetical protein
VVRQDGPVLVQQEFRLSWFDAEKLGTHFSWHVGEYDDDDDDAMSSSSSSSSSGLVVPALRAFAKAAPQLVRTALSCFSLLAFASTRPPAAFRDRL